MGRFYLFTDFATNDIYSFNKGFGMNLQEGESPAEGIERVKQGGSKATRILASQLSSHQINGANISLITPEDRDLFYREVT